MKTIKIKGQRNISDGSLHKTRVFVSNVIIKIDETQILKMYQQNKFFVHTEAQNTQVQFLNHINKKKK